MLSDHSKPVVKKNNNPKQRQTGRMLEDIAAAKFNKI